MDDRRWLRRLAGFALVGLLASCILYESNWFQKTVLYPFPYKQEIYRYARSNELDPYLIVAVMRTESKFSPTARSSKGALGLMQIMPETGQWVASQMNYPGFSPDILSEPDINIRFGAWYLASLHREFYANEVLMLAAYNGGRGNVKQWMQQFKWTANFRDVDQIPFEETRDYVKKVLEVKARYRELYAQ